MSAKLISVEGKRVRIELTIELSESMLDSEVKIQEELNEVGCIATKEALKQQDTDGSVLVIGDKKWRTKGVQAKSYQTVYGEVVVERHVYQSAGGGKTYCPMERNARIDELWGSLRSTTGLIRESWTRSSIVIHSEIDRSRRKYSASTRRK